MPAASTGRTLWAFVSLLTAVYAALGPSTDLHIVNAVVDLDGYPRQGVLAEGVFPGPLIAANKGDSFKINVINELTNSSMLKSTSIHWHGIFQRGTNWADGVAFVTQCPIASGDSFYEFHAPEQTGTYWYHSHLHLQYCDGLRGPLVIYDPQDPFAHLYDIDNEQTIITLADWYHFVASDVPFPGLADSTLINGRGRYPGGPASPLSVVSVEKGKRYRFRMINIACDPGYTFSIDRHDMTVIEVDGISHEPVHVDSIQIFVAQRYSFILHADKPVGNYWIRAQPEQFGIDKLVGFAGGINSAILRYVGAKDEEPSTSQTISVLPLHETALHPLTDAAAPGRPYPGGADKVLILNLSVNLAEQLFYVNNVSFIPPTVPVLLQILSGARIAQDILPEGSVYSLPINYVIEIVIPGGLIAGPHPFHLHGHAFSVVRSAGQTSYNFENPVQRDTVSIGNDTTDRVTIRFTTNNPGPWFLHCHIDPHLEVGLAVVLAEDIPAIAATNRVPAEWEDLCPKYNALPPQNSNCSVPTRLCSGLCAKTCNQSDNANAGRQFCAMEANTLSLCTTRVFEGRGAEGDTAMCLTLASYASRPANAPAGLWLKQRNALGQHTNASSGTQVMTYQCSLSTTQFSITQLPAAKAIYLGLLQPPLRSNREELCSGDLKQDV